MLLLATLAQLLLFAVRVESVVEYVEISDNGVCTDVKNHAWLYMEEDCRDAALARGLTWSGHHPDTNKPIGCYRYQTRVEWTPEGQSDGQCTDWAPCVCVSAPSCLIDDGSAENVGPCICVLVLQTFTPRGTGDVCVTPVIHYIHAS